MDECAKVRAGPTQGLGGAGCASRDCPTGDARRPTLRGHEDQHQTRCAEQRSIWQLAPRDGRLSTDRESAKYRRHCHDLRVPLLTTTYDGVLEKLPRGPSSNALQRATPWGWSSSLPSSRLSRSLQRVMPRRSGSHVRLPRGPRPTVLQRATPRRNARLQEEREAVARTTLITANRDRMTDEQADFFAAMPLADVRRQIAALPPGAPKPSRDARHRHPRRAPARRRRWRHGRREGRGSAYGRDSIYYSNSSGRKRDRGYPRMPDPCWSCNRSRGRSVSLVSRVVGKCQFCFLTLSAKS